MYVYIYLIDMDLMPSTVLWRREMLRSILISNNRVNLRRMYVEILNLSLGLSGKNMQFHDSEGKILT